MSSAAKGFDRGLGTLFSALEFAQADCDPLLSVVFSPIGAALCRCKCQLCLLLPQKFVAIALHILSFSQDTWSLCAPLSLAVGC